MQPEFESFSLDNLNNVLPNQGSRNPQHSQTHQPSPNLLLPPSRGVARPFSSAESSVGSCSPITPFSDPEGYFQGSSDGHTTFESEGEDITDSKPIQLTIPPDDDVASILSSRLQEHCRRQSNWEPKDEPRYPINREVEILGKKGPWDVVYERRRKDDQAKCAIWKEEIDKLLVVAGLFAATVVAFIIVSYQLLLPTPEAVMKSIHDMAVSLATEYFLNGTCGIKTDVPLSSSPNPFQPSASVIRMNTTWFLSMTLAIGTVFIGTICLQWIREYQRDTRLGPKQAFAVGQMRHDGFEAWKIPLICSLLSLSLQASLLLFFWGLLEFLWTLNTAVTLIISVIIAMVVFFMLGTIVAPAMQCLVIDSDNLHKYEQCAFKSPQARLFSVAAFTVAIYFIRLLRWLLSKDDSYMRSKETFLKVMLTAKGWDWVSFDNHWHRYRITKDGDGRVDSHYVPRALAWVGKNFVHDREAIFALYHLLRTADSSDATEIIRMIQKESDSIPDLDVSSTLDVPPDFQAARFLQMMVAKNPELHDAVLLQRIKLLIRIIDYYGYQRDSACEWESLGPFSKARDYDMVEGELAVQFAMAFRAFLRENIFPEALWRVVKNVVPRLVTQAENHESSHLVQETVRLREELNRFLRHNRYQSLSDYIGGVFLEGVFRHEESRNCQEFSEALNSLNGGMSRGEQVSIIE